VRARRPGTLKKSFDQLNTGVPGQNHTCSQTSVVSKNSCMVSIIRELHLQEEVNFHSFNKNSHYTKKFSRRVAAKQAGERIPNH
jgi:hypothetical protein